MVKKIIVFNICILTSLLVVLSSFQVQLKPNTEIVLQDEQAGFTPAQFFVKNITDERSNTAAVAHILPVDAAIEKPIAVDLKGGGFSAVKHFINHNLGRNVSLRPINVGLKTLEITESPVAGGNASGIINVTLSFYMPDRFGEDKHLLDYAGNATYKRKPGDPQEVEPALRHLLLNGLAYFNTWINQQVNNDVRFASDVKVVVDDAPKEKIEGDSIIYDVNRPLNWADFQSVTPSSRFDAEVFPSFGYNEQTELNNGIIVVKLGVKVFLPKSSSWVKENSKSPHTLNHEQRHFDITKIIAERFKKKIVNEKFLLTDYEATINEIYLDCYRELHTMQLQYDKETLHGTYAPEQELWNKKIDKELKEL